mgnify:CR=1 FL=1
MTAGAVALPEGRQRKIRVDVGHRVGAALEVGKERDQRPVELFAKVGADQRAARRIDCELGEELEQVDRAGVAPAGDHAFGLARDRLGVAPHCLVAERAVAEGLLALLRRRVEDDPGPKIGFMNG